MNGAAVYDFPHRLTGEQVDALPAELRLRPQWVRYRLTDPDTRGKRSKKPWHPLEDRPASSTDPSTWGTFEDAQENAGRHGTAGIGYVFSDSDPYLGIDLDGCFDPTTWRLSPDAATLVEAFSTYTEVSPSRTGVHLIGRGRLSTTGKKNTKVEIYDRGRFFCVTGGALEDPPAAIRDCQAEVDALLEREFGAGKMEVASAPPAGGPGPGESRHDWLVRQSVRLAAQGLSPELGFAALRGIADALPGQRQIPDAELRRMAETAPRFVAPAAPDPETVESYVGFLAEELEHEVIPPRVELFPGVALGERTMLVGAPGSGKSILQIYLALCFASGTPVFGTWPVPRPLRVVLQLEEDPPRITKSRIKRLMVGMGISWASLGGRLLVLSQTGFYAGDPVARLRVERTLKDHGAEVWFLDSITQVSGIAKQGDANEVRTFFREVINPICEPLEVTAFVSHHTTKQVWGKVQMVEDEALASGSIQFPGSVENSLLLRKTKDGARVIRSTKCRDEEEGDGISYRIQDDRSGPLVDRRPPLQIVYEGRMDREQVKAATHARTLVDDLRDLLRENPGHQFTYQAAAAALTAKAAGAKGGPDATPVTADYVRKLADQLEPVGEMKRETGNGRYNPTVIWVPGTSTP